LKAVARRLIPPAIVDRPKLGFNPPMGVWLKQDLKALVDQRITQTAMESLGLDWSIVASLIAEQKQGYRDHALKIWALLVLENWANTQSPLRG
jgi:asparagine synthase (glutamine-hydrolysing)